MTGRERLELTRQYAGDGKAHSYILVEMNLHAKVDARCTEFPY